METDTIAAVATPPGQGAVALIRLSGPGAREIAGAVFSRPLPPPRVQALGAVRAAGGEAIDEVLLTLFPAPRSYTGEDMAEIACHGGMLVTRRVLDRLLEAGARPAEPGEFSQRAFLNGKMDLTQAEAVMDLISAQTDLALRAAREQLSGRLGQALGELREELVGAIAQVEAYIDFPDEDIDPETGEALLARVAGIRRATSGLLATASQGRVLREGARAVICGLPNAGKSSLLNLLLGFDRAIVSPAAGTTRDTIEEVINLRGVPLRLVDTAGFRHSEDETEREGVSRAREQAARAEILLEVVDASAPKPPSGGAIPEEWIPEGARRLRLLNKMDLGRHPDWAGEEGTPVSCVSGEGVDELAEAILAALAGPGASWGADLVAINARHQRCLERAEGDLAAAAERLAAGDPPELAALELRGALESLGEVIGKTDVEEILGEIFRSFCIGK